MAGVPLKGGAQGLHVAGGPRDCRSRMSVFTYFDPFLSIAAVDKGEGGKSRPIADRKQHFF